MASFSTFKTLEDSLKHFNVMAVSSTIFPEDLPTILQPSEYLISELNFNIRETAYNVSEAAICEAIIFPVIKEVWKHFKDTLFLWSHKSLSKQAKDSGIPDYIIAKRSPLGKNVMDLPLLVMIEAKKDDFDEGWGQCLAQMCLAQELSKGEYPVFGVVSNGDVWQFGHLIDNTLTQDINMISIGKLQNVFNALYFIFEECRKQIQ